MFLNNKKRPAFTLIELLVVIAIIGILSTLAVVALQGARSKARDTKRISDIRQMQTALELYFNDNGYYPALVTSTIASSGIVYMATVPSSPTPADGDCSESDNNYSYTSDGSSYSINTCIGTNINSLSKGTINASPNGIKSTPYHVCGEDFVDTRDGKSYPTVQIGDQCWFAENLAYLPSVQDAATFVNNGNTSSSAYGVYNYTGTDVTAAKATANYKTYGVLYNWFAAVNSSDTNITGIIQGACPFGWHIPSIAEWTTLGTFLGGASVAGGKLKATGTTHWNSPNEGATNSSGFSALPANGRYYNSGAFGNMGSNTYFWSSSFSDSGPLYRSLHYNSTDFYGFSYSSAYGFSVRCLLN